MSSSTSSISSTTVNGTTRVTGLSSGIDVDSIVEQLVTAEKAKKLNQLQRKEQLAEWQQDAYRDIVSDIQDFSDKYFTSSSSSSLLSSKNFNKYTVTSSSSAVTATYASGASAGSHTVAVKQLATAATRTSSGLSQEVTGGAVADYSSLSGQSVAITVDGTAYTVSLDGVTSLETLQDAIDTAVGEGKLTVDSTTNSSGYLTIAAAADSGVDTVSISAPTTGTSGLSALGFAADGAVTSNRLTTSSVTLEDIAAYSGLEFSDDDAVELTINGVSFSFDKSTTVDEMMDEINDSDCGATMAYDELSGELVMTAEATGAGNLLAMSETGSNFLSAIMTGSTAGTDAVLYVDGELLTRSSNTVKVDGVTYTLNATTMDDDGTITTDEKATVSLTQDTDAVVELITGFVDDYNTLIATINEKISENSDSDYQPLTDDEKAEMDDDEIEKWEAKAKTGILEDDSLLTNMLRELRSSLVDSISGVSTSIFDVGLDPTEGTYDENGKIYIDEDALEEAVQSNLDGVISLFTQQSTSNSGIGEKWRQMSSSQLSTRYSEEGLAYRFYDIIGKYTTSITDSSGNKGLLVEKAGVADTTSETDNDLTDAIEEYQKRISDEEDRLDDYQEKMYSKYSSLETYISQMNSQLSSLSSYLSS